MSPETVKSEAGEVAETLPCANLPGSHVFLADWAREINERERAVGDQALASPGKPAPRRFGLGGHFGRHRQDD